MQQVASYEDRLYTDAQLAARRSLASMRLEEILTNRNQLSEDILHDVKESADVYTRYPALLRLIELETLRELAHSANARINVAFGNAERDKDDSKD